MAGTAIQPVARVLLFLGGVVSCCYAVAQDTPLVSKTVDGFESAAWPNAAWNRASGGSLLVDEHAPDVPPGRSLRIDVRFSGKGFEWFSIEPAKPLRIPGRLKTVTIRYRIDDDRYPLTLQFTDGWGRTEAEGRKFEWALPGGANGWQTGRFTVPPDWIAPLAITGLATHNWGAQGDARQVSFFVDELEVETDLTDMDPATGTLLGWTPDPAPPEPAKSPRECPAVAPVSLELDTGRISHLFVDERPRILVQLRNWLPNPLEGTLSTETLDAEGALVARTESRVSVASLGSVPIEIPSDRFGLYRFSASVRYDTGESAAAALTCARMPVQRELSREEKLRSPFGVNVNGGGTKLQLEPFRRAGIVWFRDYAFSYEWLQRAREEGAGYTGWPWYPTMLRRYADAGALVLPCLMTSITPPADGRIGPDRMRLREIAAAVLAFPELTHWELDNEYDLKPQSFEAEAPMKWRNYREFHRRFAEMLDVLGGGELKAVEQGPAGIFPDRVKLFVESGDFDKVGVVNSHHYCGKDAPERNIANWNTDFAGDFRAQPPMLFADRLREVKRAAQLDGRPRESWLTEFGWDTLAGPKVSPREQAVFLARGWMLALAAGTDKCFWFFDYDAPEPKQFFDGCGLLAADGSPKESLVALGALTSLMPNPEYVGTINAGPDTLGCVFRSEDRLVAAMWTILGDQGPEVTFRADELRDFLGNPLPGKTVRLTPGPVYAVGLDPADAFARQADYELTTPSLLGIVAGDEAECVIEVRNRRASPIRSTLRLELPDGWQGPEAMAVEVAPGSTQAVRLPFTVPIGCPQGSAEARLAITEEGLAKTVPVRLLIRAGLVLETEALRGQPGPAKLTVRAGNLSLRPIDAELRLVLPPSWSAEKPVIPVAGLQPGETRTLECPVVWSTELALDSTPAVELQAGGQAVRCPVMPGRLRVKRMDTVDTDSNPTEWPPETALPGRLLGGTRNAPGVALRLGWSAAGLHVFVQVDQADLSSPDPRNFWTTNALEIFVDTGDRKGDRTYGQGDHQFWFVPLPEEGRVYAGQWKRGEEIPATRYDIRAVQGTARAAGAGYVMEFTLPASELRGFQPRPGASLGLNLNLTVRGPELTHELYWPDPKSKSIADKPGRWGSAELTE